MTALNWKQPALFQKGGQAFAAGMFQFAQESLVGHQGLRQAIGEEHEPLPRSDLYLLWTPSLSAMPSRGPVEGSSCMLPGANSQPDSWPWRWRIPTPAPGSRRASTTEAKSSGSASARAPVDKRHDLGGLSMVLDGV